MIKRKPYVKIFNKIWIYIILLGLSVISSFVFMFFCIAIFSNREKGIAWGICIGLIVAQIALSIFKKYKFKPILIKTIIYSLLLFLFMYGLTNYLKPIFLLSSFLVYFFSFLSMILSWEASDYFTKKIPRQSEH